MSFVERTRSLGNNVKNLLGRQAAFALKNLGKRFTRNQLHNQIGRTAILAIIKNVGDALVIDHGCQAGLGAKPLEEPGVTHIFLLQNLDGNIAQNHFILGLPNLAHAASCNQTD